MGVILKAKLLNPIWSFRLVASPKPATVLVFLPGMFPLHPALIADKFSLRDFSVLNLKPGFFTETLF